MFLKLLANRQFWRLAVAWIVWLIGAGMAWNCLIAMLETTKWSKANLHKEALFYAIKGAIGLVAGTLSLFAFLFLSRSNKIQFGTPETEQKIAKFCYGLFALLSAYMSIVLLFDALKSQ